MKLLADAFMKQGVSCAVVAPIPLHEWLRGERAGRRVPTEGSSRGPVVHRPVYVSASNRRLWRWNTFDLTLWSYRRAVWGVVRRLKEAPHVVYGHFLYPSGATAVWMGDRLSCTAILSVGEGSLWTIRPVGLLRAKRELGGAAGAVVVSERLRRVVVEELGLPEGSVTAIPNGIDTERFRPLDRQDMRRKHGLPRDAFLVIYVGNFIDSKGVRRVDESISGVRNVMGVFVGSGPAPPSSENVAFCGRLHHEVVPEILSSADCFALPSEVEGCSNATLEAMACGLPVIVSDGTFNDEIVTDEVALRVPAMDVWALRAAIEHLRDAPLKREAMGRAAREHALQFDIRHRARRVLDFIEERRIAEKAGERAIERG